MAVKLFKDVEVGEFFGYELYKWVKIDGNNTFFPGDENAMCLTQNNKKIKVDDYQEVYFLEDSEYTEVEDNGELGSGDEV